MELEFHHVVGTATGESTLVLDSSRYENAFGNQYRVETLRYYISDVELHGPDGHAAFALAHLVDAERPETLALRLDGIPEGHYHDIVFTFGLDAEWNRTDRLPPEPQHLEMAWPRTLGGGYHYMKLEGEFLDAQGQRTKFHTHAGRLAVNDESHPHEFTVSLVAHANIVRDQVKHAEIVMDVNEWYTTPYDIDLETHSAGIMENTAAQDSLQANGADAFRLGEIEDGGHPPEP